MKKSSLLLALCLLAAPCFSQKKAKSSQVQSGEKQTLELAEALEKRLIDLKIEGLGGFQDSSLRLTFRNLAGRNLRIQIPLGQKMEPADSTWQTLVTAEPSSIALAPNRTGELRLSTFCAQAHDGSPMRGGVFALGTLAPENVRRMLKFLVEKGKTRSFDAQSAVWCVTDRHPLAAISDPELLKFASDLLGKPMPNYHVQFDVAAPPRPSAPPPPRTRQVLGPALKLDGHCAFELEKTEKLSLVLFDSAGQKLRVLFRDREFRSGEHESRFHMELNDLRPGKYWLRLQNAAGKLVKEIPVEF